MTYLIIAIILLVVETVWCFLGARLGLIDKTANGNDRSPYTDDNRINITSIRAGGIIYLAAIWIWAAFYGWGYPWFVTGATLAGIVSFADDLHPLTIRLRLIVQFVTVALLFIQAGIFSYCDALCSPALYYAIIVMVAIVSVGIINAFNFMDGINGMTAGYTLAVFFSLLWLNSQYMFMSQTLLITVTIAAAVFAMFNFRRRAICFAGDVGAITAGCITVYALSALIYKTQNFAYIGLLTFYGVDSILTIIRRIRLGQNIGTTHHMHLYQELSRQGGMSQPAISACYALGQMAFSAAIIFVPGRALQYAVLCAGIAILVIAYNSINRRLLK